MTTYQEWKQKAEALSLDGRAFIAGQRANAASNETFSGR